MNFQTIRTFLRGDFQSSGRFIFLTTIAVILIQKLFYLADVSFLYDYSLLGRSTGSWSYALLSMFSVVRNDQLRYFFVFSEIFLCMFLLLRPFNLMAYGLLVFFSVNTFYGASYLQDGGNNLSQLFLVLALPFAISQLDSLPNDLKKHLNLMGMIIFRFQIVFIYLAALVSKLQGDLWRSGKALYYIFQNDYFTNSIAREAVLSFPILSTVGCYVAIAFQLLFPLAIFTRRGRIPAIIAGTIFHVSIAFFMNLWIFSLSMVAFYLVFLNASEIDLIHRLIGEKFHSANLSGYFARRGKSNVNNNHSISNIRKESDDLLA